MSVSAFGKAAKAMLATQSWKHSCNFYPIIQHPGSTGVKGGGVATHPSAVHSHAPRVCWEQHQEAFWRPVLGSVREQSIPCLPPKTCGKLNLHYNLHRVCGKSKGVVQYFHYEQIQSEVSMAELLVVWVGVVQTVAT